MKFKVVAGILMTIFILGGISSASAANYDGDDPITIKNGDSFELDLMYNEWVNIDGYDHDMLKLVKKERSAPIDGYWCNMYTFKSLKTGTTQIKIKIQVLWWENEKTVDVNIQ